VKKGRGNNETDEGKEKIKSDKEQTLPPLPSIVNNS
jgi:hypothetical protein